MFGNQYRTGEREKGKQRLSALLENQFWTKMCKVFRASGSIFHSGANILQCVQEKTVPSAPDGPREQRTERGEAAAEAGSGLTPSFPLSLPGSHPSSSVSRPLAGPPPGQRQHGKGCQATSENDRDAPRGRWTPFLRLLQTHKDHQKVPLMGCLGTLMAISSNFKGDLRDFFP